MFPKVELHTHLDCNLSFDAVRQLRPGIDRGVYEKEFVSREKFRDLADFLKIIDGSLDLMQTEKGLQIVTEDLFRQYKEDNLIYAEIRFAPLLHVREGLTPEQVVRIVEAAVDKYSVETGIESRIILCTLRHYNKSQGMETVRLVEQFAGSRVVGLDIGADEAGFPIDAHIAAFQYAFERGLYRTAHAGEARGPESVKDTLEFFKPTRLGHGVRSIEDDELVKRLVEEKIHLEICPSCNVAIDVFDRYEDHSIDRLYRAGVSVGINTDTRAIIDLTLTKEYMRLHKTFGWQKEDFLKCNQNTLEAAFLPENEKLKLIQSLTNGYNPLPEGL